VQQQNAEKLYKAYQTHRNSKTLQEFLRYLSNYNQKGTNLYNLPQCQAVSPIAAAPP
jgi:hypothetical protein